MSEEKIPFKNNKGEVMMLSPKLTIQELVKMGVTNISIVNPEDIIKDGEWRDCE